MGAPKNFYNTVDQRKLGLDKLDHLDETISEALAGAIVANPEGIETSELLNTLKIGDETYLVNYEETITHIKALRIVGRTMQGNDNNIVLRGPIKISNQYSGEVYQYAANDSIITDATGASGVNNLITNGSTSECYLPSSALPITLDITFGDTVDMSEYNTVFIGCGPYRNASLKSVEIWISTDGTHFVKVLDNPDIGYTSQAYREVGLLYEADKPDSVIITITDDTINPITCDYSFADIKNMIENGINIAFKVVDPEDSSLVGYTRCVSMYSLIYVELFAGDTTTEYTIKPSAITRTDYSRTAV